MTDSPVPQTILVGAGVVGCAILKAHLDAGVSVCLADQEASSLKSAVDAMRLSATSWRTESIRLPGTSLTAVGFVSRSDQLDSSRPPIIVESISEKLDVKQAFFREAEDWFGTDALLCSNTSTLRISDIASALTRPERFCGMHFFMPVYNRPAVEIARGESTSQETIERCASHVQQINKEPLVVRDGPGFIVNRLLSPYLNESLLLLCRGIDAQRIERAALTYGMPMSPLELIDWIGTRTMFDAGRAFWQAFPNRISPAAVLAALIKNKRSGRAGGGGLYDYVDGARSPDISPIAVEFSQRYQREVIDFSDQELVHLLSIPMWIEAAIARHDQVVGSNEQLDLAMRGGLGYAPERSWLGFFDDLGSQVIRDAIDRWSSMTSCMSAPTGLIEALESSDRPTDAIGRFASSS